jgi:F0F1-type ATP synthase membrane subunit b/b'
LKTLVKLVLLVVVVMIALPLFRYRTIRPCSALKKERIERIQEGIESAGEEAREAVSEHSERAERIVDDVSEALEGLADGLAERVAELEVDEMSTRECLAELWKLRKKD